MNTATGPCTPPTTPPLDEDVAPFGPSSTTTAAVTATSSSESASAFLRRRKPGIASESSTPDAAPSVDLSENLGVSITDTSGNTQSLSQDELRLLLQSPQLREILSGSLHRAGATQKVLKRRKFRDLIFTKQFSAFDGQNDSAANSPFLGFFNLFWMGVFLYVLKIVIINVANHGNLLGTHEILSTMVSRDLMFLGLADGVMCALTGVSWLLQCAILAGHIDWDRSGWLLQHLWQTVYIGSVVGLTLYRDWPWTHTVFFVIHGLTMLMKQHSYSFYNGYLSSIYHERNFLLTKLKELDTMAPSRYASESAPAAADIQTSHLSTTPHCMSSEENDLYARREQHAQSTHDHDLQAIAAAIGSGKPLDLEQINTYERIIKWEVDALGEELKGCASTPDRAYPNNLTAKNCAEWIVLPTLVYELEYPRSESINWRYVAVKLTAVFGVIFVMMLISQHFIYPVLSQAAALKAANVPLIDRFKAWPALLGDLMFPFMMEYMLTWYLIWETILNLLAELTFFADRSFYDAWWNSVSWDQYARDWNRPVHNFLLRHVYHSSQASMNFNRPIATLITFFLSACVHELVMWCLFKKLRGYLLVMQMCQVPLVAISRTGFLKGRKTLGNLIFWLGIFTGPSLLCSLYVIL